MSWREYHDSTKHSLESLRRARHVLDWADMPDPFRHYEGVPILDLPADPPAPETPALAILNGAGGATAAKDGGTFLSQLLYYSASISASKRVPSTGYRYALRVNPSSGNLHPTEFHLLARGLHEWPDGLYHYRPSSHMAEQRATGNLELTFAENAAPIVLILTSIVSREAWKYGDRAYRNCLHDIGHAWQAIATAAQAIDARASRAGVFLTTRSLNSAACTPMSSIRAAVLRLIPARLVMRIDSARRKMILNRDLGMDDPRRPVWLDATDSFYKKLNRIARECHLSRYDALSRGLDALLRENDVRTSALNRSIKSPAQSEVFRRIMGQVSRKYWATISTEEKRARGRRSAQAPWDRHREGRS